MIALFVGDRYLSNETPYAGKWKLVGWNRIFRTLVVASLGLYVAFAPPWALAGGTSYETQIAGFIYSSLRNFIVGEFAGRSAANIVAKMGCRSARQATTTNYA